jgi:hypothetical protein
VFIVPRKHMPKTECVLLAEMWADLVENDPALAQALGQISLLKRLALIPKRLIDWMAGGFCVEGLGYPWI